MTKFKDKYEEDKFFIEKADFIGKASPCIREDGKVGAIAVKGSKILAEATNGEVGGISCKELGFCIRQKYKVESGTRRELAYCICSEQKLILKLLKTRNSLAGITVYVNLMPCALCLRLLTEAGVKRIVYLKEYTDKFSKELVKLLPITLEKFEYKN